MSAWPKARLEDCAEIVSGATPSTSTETYWGGDICWATPKDLSDLDGAYIENTPRKLTPAGLENCAAKVLPAGSVLFSSRAPIGHVAVNTIPMATNQGFKSFVPKPDQIIAKFLYWWLRTNRTYLESLGNGATFKEVSKTIVSKIEIPLPPLAEQRRIAEVLDKAEALRAKRRAALAQLDSLTQSLFLDLFGDPATNPKGWLMKKLGDVANIGSGAGFPLNYQGLSDGEFPFYKVSDMNTQGNETSMQVARHTISEDVRRVLRAETFPPGAIIFPKIGAAIATNKKRLLVRDSCIDNNVMAVAPGDPIESRYLFSLLSFKDISDFAQKGNPPSMRKSDVERWEIPIPPLDLQREFARRVASVEKLKTAQRAALAELDALFASLQHRAFRGEL